MKKKYILILLVMLIAIQQYGQTFEEYKKQQESEFEAYKQKQQEFIKQMQNEFDEYVKQRDNEFAEFLEERWESFTVFKGEAPPNIPKPPVKPKYEPTKPVEVEETGTVKQLKNPLMVIDDGKARPVIPSMIKKTAETKADLSVVEFSFYGNDLSFNFDDELLVNPPVQINEAGISEFWLSFSDANFVHLLNQLQNYKSVMNLNDWAYYLLVKAFSSEVYPESEIGADLMIWTVLTRSGYKARVGYTKNEISVLLPTHNTLYSMQYLKSDGLNYYLMKELSTDNINTYKKDYPDAEGAIDFNFYRPLNFAEDLNQKSFDFDYRQNHYSITVDYNKNIIDFYNDFPQVNLEVYFNAAVSPASKESLVREFSKITSGMSGSQAVSLLLQFVQTAFNYEVDDKQFGKEKFLFAEETVFYPASDCEDRSVLFAYLVKELLNFKVIGLEYPGHVSTAVKLAKGVEGDRVIFENEEYIVADATYVNAPLGLTMTDYRNKTPEVIVLSNSNYFENKNQSYWVQANQSGGFRGDRLNDILVDDNGNTYLTGYYVETANFGEYTLETGYDQPNRGAFVVKYNTQKNVQWAKRINSEQNATGYAIVNDKDGNLYVTGSFKGEIDVGGDHQELVCKENMTDVFLAKFNKSGQLLWIKKAGLDTYPQENFFTYNIKFSEDGTGMGTTFYSENEFNGDFGLFYNPSGSLCITGSFMNSTGFGLNMLSLKTDEVESMEVSESLKFENDKLIDENCEKTIAGVFAAINLVKLNGFKMLGTDAQKTLDEHNPGFSEEYPEIYENLGKINFLLNDDGIVTVETISGKAVLIRELKLKNNAKMKIVPYEDGNVKVDIFSGVQVGKFFIWFDLNYVKMFKSNGNLLFDYDKDHSQITRNMKKHILK